MKVLHIIRERTPSGNVDTIIKDQAEAGGIDGRGGGHAASPVTTVPSSS